MPKGCLTRHDLSGQIFGRLTATSTSEIRGRNRVYWLCLCACTKEKWVISDALKSGATRSCGCLNDEARRVTIHGATQHGQTREYKAWHHMKQRCLNPKTKRFSRYGGRGIAICDRWLNSFENFLSDMGKCPSGMSIERENNDGNYEPGNCRWATTSEQNRNTSRKRLVTFNGLTLNLADWQKRTGIPHATLHYRLKNWSVERAFTEPLGASR